MMDITLVLSEKGFKYESEAVLKLFYPVQGFSFIYLDEDSESVLPNDNFCFVRRIKDDSVSKLYVKVIITGQIESETETVSNDISDYDNECEFILGRLLFLCLRRITGISPEWGVLTGVRPMKLINRIRNSGHNHEATKSLLRERYLISDEKIDIGYETSVNQERVISATPKRSFSLYVDIPFCPTRCSYCSFISQTVSSFKKLMPEYVGRLCEEIMYTAQLVNEYGLTLDTVYFGGGTPTSISADNLDRIMKTVSRSFDMSSLREYTVEAGRPDTITFEKLSVIFENGGDRISINPQTMNDSVLSAIGRSHTVSEFMNCYELAKEFGFKAVNVDLIAGLPTDTLESFTDSVDKVIDLSPENITVHALSIKRSSELMQRKSVGDGEMCERMIKYSVSKLHESGYLPYYLYRQKNQLGNQENIGWTKRRFAGVYNINIMEENQTIIAVGAGGTTKIVGANCPDDKLNRFFNPKYPLEYLKHFDTVLSRKDKAAELFKFI